MVWWTLYHVCSYAKFRLLYSVLFFKVPFLTASTDVGNRVVTYEGRSEFYGDFIIEDVQSADQYYYRQLIFRQDFDTVQSQTRLMIGT